MRLNAEDPEHDFRPSPGRGHALPAGARAGRARRHVPRDRLVDPAVLRLAGREARRVGRRPPAAIARAERALRETRDRGRRRRRATSRSRCSRASVRERRLLDLDARELRGGSRRDALAPPGPPPGALPALPVGSLGPGDRLAVRAARSTRGRAASPRPSPRAPRSSTSASRRRPRAGPPTGSARSSGARCGSPCTSSRRGEVPAEVAISEAVGFAKRYAPTTAARLVNGILDAFNGRRRRER